MDFSNDGANTRLQDELGTEEQEGRAGAEARSQQGPRLQKKRSNAGQRPANPRPQTYAPTSTIREDHKTRKGSIRNVIRRVFGRRSREAEPEPEPVPRPSPGHGYHRSEPPGLSSQPEIPEGGVDDSGLAQRTFSVPVVPISSPVLRTRSPYAVEFPQSSRLKPINLGSPFTAPGSTLRRRKTLPSVLISEPEAAIVQAAVQPQGADSTAAARGSQDAPSLEIGRAFGTTVAEKRKSRSADDLRRAEVETSRLSRKRSEEIQFWRDSIQGGVLRASGFRAPSPAVGETEEREGDRTPMARTDDPFVIQGEPSGLSPARSRPHDLSPSALGSQMSQDLEDRVARLEAGLRSFRGELAQIAADRNRRTILIGSAVPSTRRRRASSDGRTASMLAETLQSDIEPSSYQYEYSGTARPSTSPEPPRTPTRFADPSAAVPAMPVYQRTSEEQFRTPSPPGPSTATAGNGNGSSRNQAPQYTFRSLYEMLTDERSARRRLESQMRGLREEISNLHYQVSLQSNVQSQRSSYYAQGSSRLHALLRETEDSPPGVGAQQRESGSVGLSAEQQRVVSRFSGSESESGVGDLQDQTPYEVFQTPLEEHARSPFGEPQREGSDMF